MRSHISISKENDKIIVIAGNPVTDDVKDNLVMKLDHINQLDEAALKTLYEHVINRDPKLDEKGAGLGLISMSIKSGNKIKYSFNPLTNGYLYFEIQISLNKYIMRKLIIDQT